MKDFIDLMLLVALFAIPAAIILITTSHWATNEQLVIMLSGCVGSILLLMIIWE